MNQFQKQFYSSKNIQINSLIYLFISTNIFIEKRVTKENRKI